MSYHVEGGLEEVKIVRRIYRNPDMNMDPYVALAIEARDHNGSEINYILCFNDLHALGDMEGLIRVEDREMDSPKEEKDD